MDQLAGRTALITGGAQGIGLGIARAIARRGVKIALADVNESLLRRAEADLAADTEVVGFVLDVRDRDGFARAADEAESRLGPVSLLFNNAGVAGGVSVAKMTYELWDWVLGINLDGVVNGIQTFVPRMIERGGGGYVVNTSSGAGLVEHGAGFLYTTSKFAVVGLSESLRGELGGYGIGVSVLCPGPVATSIVYNTAELRPDTHVDSTPAAAARLEKSNRFLASGAAPDDVGERVVEAIRCDQLYIYTDTMMAEPIKRRTEALLAAIPRERAAADAVSSNG